MSLRVEKLSFFTPTITIQQPVQLIHILFPHPCIIPRFSAFHKIVLPYLFSLLSFLGVIQKKKFYPRLIYTQFVSPARVIMILLLHSVIFPAAAGAP